MKFNRELFVQHAKRLIGNGVHPAQVSNWRKGVDPSIKKIVEVYTKSKFPKKRYGELFL